MDATRERVLQKMIKHEQIKDHTYQIKNITDGDGEKSRHLLLMEK